MKRTKTGINVNWMEVGACLISMVMPLIPVAVEVFTKSRSGFVPGVVTPPPPPKYGRLFVLALIGYAVFIALTVAFVKLAWRFIL